MIGNANKQADKQRLLLYICRYDFLAPNEDALPEKYRGRNLEDAKENLIIDKGKLQSARISYYIKTPKKNSKNLFFCIVEF